MSPLRPGDVVCCPGCAAVSAPAVVSSSRRWAEGDAVLLSWFNGPHPRHESAREPGLCLWCEDRRLGFPALMNRPLPAEAPWTAGGPARTWEIPPVGAPVLPPMAHRTAEGTLVSHPTLPGESDTAYTRRRSREWKAALGAAVASACPKCGNPPGEHAGTACPEDRPTVECRTCGEKHDGTCVDAGCWMAMTQDEKERLASRPRLARGFTPPIGWKNATLRRVAQRDVSAARELELEKADRAAAALAAQDAGVGPSPARADAPPRAHAATGEIPLERPARAQLALF